MLNPSRGSLYKSDRIKILDGSFAFQLEKHIGKKLESDPLWSARHLSTHPDAVMNVHIDYLKAGSDIIETNTYQASIPGFMKHLNLSEQESYDLIKKAVVLAKQAVEKCMKDGVFDEDGRIPLIAGSVGPYGAHLNDASEYTGNYTDHTATKVIEDYHRPRIQALVEGGVDLLALETMPSRREAEIVVNLLKEYPNIKAWLSFSCKDDGILTVYGDDFKQAAKHCYELNKQQLIAVGVNCTPPAACVKLLTGINDSMNTTKIPLVVYANSGEKYNPDGWDNHPESFEKYIPQWIEAGVKYIGGCCRVCDNYISKIREIISLHENT